MFVLVRNDVLIAVELLLLLLVDLENAYFSKTINLKYSASYLTSLDFHFSYLAFVCLFILQILIPSSNFSCCNDL